MHCTPATAVSCSSKAISTSLSTAPCTQVASLSLSFHKPQVLTAQASAFHSLPHHPPDHVTSASGIPVTSTTQQPSAMLRPPRHPPDHVTLTSAVPVSLTPQKRVSSTRACTDDSPTYNTSMLDIYRMVTACGHPNFRGAHLPLPSNFDVHEWSPIAHTQGDQEVLQYLKCGFQAGFEGPFPTPCFGNHSSAVNRPRDVKAYITTELSEGPFPRSHFTI